MVRVCKCKVIESTGIPKDWMKRTRSRSAESTSTGTLWRITTMMIILKKARTRQVSNV